LWKNNLTEVDRQLSGLRVDSGRRFEKHVQEKFSAKFGSFFLIIKGGLCTSSKPTRTIEGFIIKGLRIESRLKNLGEPSELVDFQQKIIGGGEELQCGSG